MTVTRPSGISQIELVRRRRCRCSPSVSAAGRPAGPWPGLGVVGGHAALLPVRPLASSQSRNGAPKAPVTTPTGRLRSAKGSRRRSRATTTIRAPTRPAAGSVVRPPLRARAIGPARNATNATGPAAATPTATSSDAEQQQERRCGRGRRPRPAAASSPSSVARSDRASPRGDGQQHGQGERQQPDRRPVDAVDAAGQPAQHQLDVVLVDAGEDVLDDRLHGRGEADPSEHEPEARRGRRRPARTASATPSAPTMAAAATGQPVQPGERDHR